jgi:Mitochondrial carrier protein
VPAELIKARMQTQAFRSIGHCLKDAIARERGGLRGLYTGYAATMIRDLPYFALQLGFYGNVCFTVTSEESSDSDSVLLGTAEQNSSAPVFVSSQSNELHIPGAIATMTYAQNRIS